VGEGTKDARLSFEGGAVLGECLENCGCLGGFVSCLDKHGGCVGLAQDLLTDESFGQGGLL